MFLVLPDKEVALTHNRSGRFESRFVSVGVQESPSIWLKGMEGSALGVWVAHGEGTVCSHCVFLCSFFFFFYFCCPWIIKVIISV